MKLPTAEWGKYRSQIFAWGERDTWYESNKTFQFTSCLPHSGKGEQAKEHGVHEVVSNIWPHLKGPVLFLSACLTWPVHAGINNLGEKRRNDANSKWSKWKRTKNYKTKQSYWFTHKHSQTQMHTCTNTHKFTLSHTLFLWIVGTSHGFPLFLNNTICIIALYILLYYFLF